MKAKTRLSLIASAVLAVAAVGGVSAQQNNMSFFVTSRTGGGNLGGLSGADTICKNLATAVGQGSKNWVAYLSTTTPAMNAKIASARARGSTPPA